MKTSFHCNKGSLKERESSCQWTLCALSPQCLQWQIPCYSLWTACSKDRHRSDSRIGRFALVRPKPHSHSRGSQRHCTKAYWAKSRLHGRHPSTHTPIESHQLIVPRYRRSYHYKVKVLDAVSLKTLKLWVFHAYPRAAMKLQGGSLELAYIAYMIYDILGMEA